jgi:hypothetical protein
MTCINEEFLRQVSSYITIVILLGLKTFLNNHQHAANASLYVIYILFISKEHRTEQDSLAATLWILDLVVPNLRSVAAYFD